MTQIDMNEYVVVVTGGLRGIGRATADRFVERGATVVVTSRNPGNQHSASHSAGAREPLVRRLDVRDDDSVMELFAWVDAELGRLDVLVNNAGVGVFGPVETITTEQFRNVVATDLAGAFACAREAFKRMKAQGGGRIINVGSIADHRALPGNAAYSAAKFGLRGLSLVLAEEGASCQVRVSLVSPGAVWTDIWHEREGFDRADMLRPADVAGVIVDIAERPLSVRLDEIRMAPPKGILEPDG